MAERKTPPLNLSRLKMAGQRVAGGPGGGGGARSSNGINSQAMMPTLFDATAELAADLQRREARRAAARAEAAEVEGEASVLEALASVHRLLREAGEWLRWSERERG